MDAAHGVVPTHEIFHKPLAVNLQYEDRPTPDNYLHYPGGDKLGKTMKVWKVQDQQFPEVDPGLVSDPFGFGDSPDAEVISSGINSKGPNSVALGRHGNFFLWGFSAPPSGMTPEARKCFVNSVCYAHKFDGQKPLVPKTSSGREWALVYAGYIDQVRDEKFLERLFPEEVRKECGKDAAKYRQYYRENLEYLRSGQRGYEVDEDAKQLGVSNRKVELLDRCVALLERGEDRDRALRLLKRYTECQFDQAAEWRAWLEKHRSRLFFTDTGGYKFLVAPEATAEAARNP
jgi:hypothetical protein